jgi:GNAT superfamily N-acetyltransferase
MLSQRSVDTFKDRDFLLNLICLREYDKLPHWARTTPYLQYREAWLKTDLSTSFIKELADSLDDERTIAEVWEEDGRPVGFLWLTFDEVESQDLTFAEIREISVAAEHQRRGIGGLMLRHAEERAQKLGAIALRSETEYDNAAAQAMHGSHGFKVVSYQYEKVLTGSPD